MDCKFKTEVDYANNMLSITRVPKLLSIIDCAARCSVETGTVTNGTVSGRIEGVTGSSLSAFIYLGGYYPVYSKLFWL